MGQLTNLKHRMIGQNCVITTKIQLILIKLFSTIKYLVESFQGQNMDSSTESDSSTEQLVIKMLLQNDDEEITSSVTCIGCN